MNRRAAGYMAVYVLLMECGVIFLLPLGAYMHISGEITVSTFMLFMFMGLGFARFMKQLTGFGSRITQIMKGVEQLMSVLGTPGIPEGKGDSMPDNFDLEFRDVSFSYGRQAVLRNIGFRVRRGQVLALVGPSGAGKTTIARLIARFYDADSGRITIGGTDIREFSSERLMRTVSFVFQDVFMFNDTVLENIRMGDSSVSREKVMELARKARAHEFIMKMDKGYDTRLGAGGVHLSGGEQQRISIARAMAKETPIVVLDEATSYSDTENEAEIQAALSSLLEGRTVIVIAHRLSSITESDGIIVIRDGSIVEQGKHHELLEKKGLYSRMWETHRDSSDWEIPVSGCVKTHEEAVI
jgi:ATP-binding cassette subfamily B protein